MLLLLFFYCYCLLVFLFFFVVVCLFFVVVFSFFFVLLCVFFFFFFFFFLTKASEKPLCQIKIITKTCLYNFDPLKPHFYIVKLGFRGVYIIFSYFYSKT